MKTKKSIKRSNLPTKLPFIASIVYYLLLDRLDANDFTWGVFITIFSFIWIIKIYESYKEQKIDIFENQKGGYGVKNDNINTKPPRESRT